MSQHVRAVLVVLLSAAVVSPVAKAAPVTPYLDFLRDAVQARFDSIPVDAPADRLAERDALALSLVALKARSRSIDGDLKMFQRAATPIETLEALATTPIPDELNTSFYAFRGYVGGERDELSLTIDALVDPAMRQSAAADLAAMDVALEVADGPNLTSTRATLLRTAHGAFLKRSAEIARATAPRRGRARPGKAYVACFVDDTLFVPRFGGSTAGADGGADSRVAVTGYGSRLEPALEISWDNGAFTGPGTYALDGTSGALIVLVAGGATYQSDSGSVVVTEFDQATRRIAGTFTGTVATEAGSRRVLTNGAFTAVYATRAR